MRMRTIVAGAGTRPRRAFASAVGPAALLAFACGGSAPDVNPEALPRPDLTRLVPPARAQLEDARRALEAAVASGGSGAVEQPLGRLCRLYVAYGFDAAAAEACAAAGRHGGDPRWPYLEGVARTALGETAAAERALRRADARGMEDPAVHLRLAELALDAGRLGEAEARFRAVLAAGDEGAFAWWGLGRVARARGEPRAAAAAFRKVLALQPEADATHHALGLALRDAGDAAAARRELARGGNRAPRFTDRELDALVELVVSAEMLVAQGDRAVADGRVAQAAVFYRKALALEPDHVRALHNLGALFGRAGRHEAARRHLQRAVEEAPDRVDARVDLASALAALGHLDRAAAELEVAVGRAPEDLEAWRRLALVLEALGRVAEAEMAVERLRAIDSDAVDRQDLAPSGPGAGPPSGPSPATEGIP